MTDCVFQLHFAFLNQRPTFRQRLTLLHGDQTPQRRLGLGQENQLPVQRIDIGERTFQVLADGEKFTVVLLHKDHGIGIIFHHFRNDRGPVG